jgi:D-citramalate synthase
MLLPSFTSEVRIFDTTLRDGEQTPGVSLTPESKLRIAEQLDELGVNVIEAGFAAASEGELEAIKAIANAGFKAEICSMTRGVIKDVDSALKSDAQSIHLVIPTSDLHIKYKLKKKREDVLKITADCVQYAKDHGLIVELSAEDATRSDFEFLEKMFKTGISAGADRICVCDTVGVLTPDRSYDLFSKLRKTFQDLPISVHCHDDFGMAVANSLSAIRAGANQVHVTVNGLGERAGNAALEEVVVALRSLYGVKLPLKLRMLWGLSRLVCRLTGVYTPPNKAIVGENAFTHEAGIHTHGILAHPMTYEPISPEMVGVKRRLAVGKHAGRHGIKVALEEMGVRPSEEQLDEICRRVKEIGDKGKTVTDADLQAIAEAVIGLPKSRPIRLEELTVVTGNKVTPTASVRLKFNEKVVSGAATGVGPVDAAMKAILGGALAGVEPIELEEYKVKAITGGTDAVVEVSVRLRRGDRVATAVSAREDIVMASVDAMLSGINVLMAEYKQTGRP